MGREKIENNRDKKLQFNVTIEGEILIDFGKQKCQSIAKEAIKKEYKKYLKFDRL